jgi:hypothetical protein
VVVGTVVLVVVGTMPRDAGGAGTCRCRNDLHPGQIRSGLFASSEQQHRSQFHPGATGLAEQVRPGPATMSARRKLGSEEEARKRRGRGEEEARKKRRRGGPVARPRPRPPFHVECP